MRTKSILSSLALTAALLAGAPLFAQHQGHHTAPKKEQPAGAGKLLPVTEKDADWAAKQRQSYPLDVCLTSDEKLGSMGKSPEYIYRVAGQPDRLVVFCCDGCEEDFLKEPAKYLAKLDQAAKGKKPAGNKSGKSHGGGHHE